MLCLRSWFSLKLIHYFEVIVTANCTIRPRSMITMLRSKKETNSNTNISQTEALANINWIVVCTVQFFCVLVRYHSHLSCTCDLYLHAYRYPLSAIALWWNCKNKLHQSVKLVNINLTSTGVHDCRTDEFVCRVLENRSGDDRPLCLSGHHRRPPEQLMKRTGPISIVSGGCFRQGSGPWRNVGQGTLFHGRSVWVTRFDGGAVGMVMLDGGGGSINLTVQLWVCRVVRTRTQPVAGDFV